MIVYTARSLREQYPDITRIIENRLSERSIVFKELDSSNIWVRDWMPIKTGNCYTKFQYKRNPKYPWLEVSSDIWQFANAKISDIYLDGGNVVQNDDTVFITEIVFKNNPDISRVDLMRFLKDRFEKKIVFIPVEPTDDLGHSDGIIKLKNRKTVIINDYRSRISQTWVEYAMKLEKILTDNGYAFIKMPWAYNEKVILEHDFRKQYPLADEQNEAIGYYINYYEVVDMIFLPQFKIPQDDDAYLFMSKHFPGYEIVPVDCSGLAMLGGCCNCISWEFE